MTDKEKIRKEVVGIINSINLFTPDEDGKNSSYEAGKLDAATKILQIIDSLQEEPVSEELEKAAEKAAVETFFVSPQWTEIRKELFKAGAKWQEKQDQYIIELAEDHAMFAGMEKMREQMMKNIWKPADGDDLPEIDREVIVLIKYNAQRNIHDEEYPTYRVGFGHRPNPDGWDGKNIDTNEVTHYTPKLYDKGGWNAPDIAYWLDARLPYEKNKIIK